MHVERKSAVGRIDRDALNSQYGVLVPSDDVLGEGEVQKNLRDLGW